jgi:hypothetical protein
MSSSATSGSICGGCGLSARATGGCGASAARSRARQPPLLKLAECLHQQPEQKFDDRRHAASSDMVPETPRLARSRGGPTHALAPVVVWVRRLGGLLRYRRVAHERHALREGQRRAGPGNARGRHAARRGQRHRGGRGRCTAGGLRGADAPPAPACAGSRTAGTSSEATSTSTASSVRAPACARASRFQPVGWPPPSVSAARAAVYLHRRRAKLGHARPAGSAGAVRRRRQP